MPGGKFNSLPHAMGTRSGTDSEGLRTSLINFERNLGGVHSTVCSSPGISDQSTSLTYKKIVIIIHEIIYFSSFCLFGFSQSYPAPPTPATPRDAAVALIARAMFEQRGAAFGCVRHLSDVTPTQASSLSCSHATPVRLVGNVA